MKPINDNFPDVPEQFHAALDLAMARFTRGLVAIAAIGILVTAVAFRLLFLGEP